MRPHKTAKRNCLFCRTRTKEIDYKDTVVLRKFLNKRGAITTRESRWVRKKIWDETKGSYVNHPNPNIGRWAGGNGLCRSHQSQLRTAVLRAREMALLPYQQDKPVTSTR